MSKDNKYKVGYGKPPKESRFPKGHSGNPKGRPKNTGNLKKDLQSLLEQDLIIKENGQRKTISAQRAMIQSVLTKALKGDMRATALIIKLMERHLYDELIDNGDAELSQSDKALMLDALSRYESIREISK